MSSDEVAAFALRAGEVAALALKTREVAAFALRTRPNSRVSMIPNENFCTGDIIDGFIRSSTAINETFPQMIIPHESCDIPLLTLTQAL